MTKIYKLYNQIKHYEWGSTNHIPEFINLENYKSNTLPYAEMWMGTHSSAPSKIELNDKMVELQNISGDLPFLLKLLGVEKPLSIQAHPNIEQATNGFLEEEQIGIYVNAPTRNYKDSNQKHEIMCALSPFTLMAGFRSPYSVLNSIKLLLSINPKLNDFINPMILALEQDSLSGFFIKLNSFSDNEKTNFITLICEIINSIDDKIDSYMEISFEQWLLMKRLAKIYPGDLGILSPLYLNLLTLKAGEAVYIPAGVLHAYLSGLGIELMTSSDNVLRGGLTPKYVDINELVKILRFEPFIPQIINPTEEIWSTYETPCKDFLLGKIKCEDKEVVFPVRSPTICIVTEGTLSVNNVFFNKGDSFFIPVTDEPVKIKGNFDLFSASIPCE
jgi:mannose-6-phosphate isomerase